MSHKKEQRRGKRKKPLSHGWIVVPSKSYRDRVYFYNVVTKCSTWINPCEVLDDETSSQSSETSVESRHYRQPTSSLPKRQTTDKSFPNFMKENTDIEDYDDQDERFFDEVFDNNFSIPQSTVSDSPDSVLSSKTTKTDSDTSKSLMIFENNSKEVWLHFASSPKNNKMKKSVALSDFEQPSTSGLGVEKEKHVRGQCDDETNVCGKSRRNKKKKNKKREGSGKSEKEEKRKCDKTVKIVPFKVKDKTPAQTRILKFRRQYAEKIKKLVESSPPLKGKDRNKSCGVNCSSSAVNQLDFGSFSDHSEQGVNFQNNFHNEMVLNADLSEEMDWEPSSEESDVRNINEFRQQQDKGQTSNNISHELNGCHKHMLPLQTQELVLLLDTNIFVSCLNFVKELRDTKVGDLSYPIIYVPWRVLQELDHLKDSNGANKKLSMNVRKAISFLNENFRFKHPRVFGQSFEDFNNMTELGNLAPDDEILHTCIQLKKRHSNIKLILLTNDKNLESKANVSGVKVHSKESFEKKYLNSFTSTCSNSLNVITPHGQMLQPRVQIDNYICEIKTLLKDFLTVLVETEMRVAFEGDWIKVINKKPPWTAKEALDCFLKHWRSVFFLVFSKVTCNEAENLNEKLFVKQPANMEHVCEVISIIQRFIRSIISSQKKKRPYLDLTDGILSKLNYLLRETQRNDAPQVESRISQTQFPLVSTSNDSYVQPHSVTSDITPHDLSKVKNLFRDIWESLRCFCCSMSDVMNSSNPGSNTSLPELRLKLVQILNEVGELVTLLEKIFEINVPDINERHPLIIHFARFLSNLHPAINVELQNKFPKCLAAFFTDFEGRSLLERSLTDFREFSQELFKTSEFFKSNFA